MANNVPQWADPQLSANLANVRAAGESPTVEFKERFPDQAHRLAQELAALGTSGGGMLIGINDNCELVGIDAPNGDARDSIAERVHGTISTIRPNLRAEILFAVENEIPVVAIRIPTQDEPVFYYDHRPYIRDGRRSRPANRNEVKEAIWAHPSSEFKREAERLKLETEQSVLDSARSQSEALAEMRSRFVRGD